MKRLIVFLALLFIAPIGTQAQLLESITVKEILPTVNSKAQSDFAQDVVLTNALFFALEYQGVGLEMDVQTGKATGWLYRYYSASLDSAALFVGVKVTLVGPQAVKLPLDTITQYFPVTIGTTGMTDPWVDSDAALQGSKDGGADTFIQAHPETRVALAFTINNPVQNKYIPQGKYWVFNYQADSDTMTCMVDAPTGLPFRCLGGNEPRILTNPPTTAQVGIQYVYTVNAFGNPLPGYSLEVFPTGMSIDARSGRITWTPVAGDEGQHDVTVRASNPSGFDEQSYRITVSSGATEPHITSSPVTEAFAGKQYTYKLSATGSPPPTYTLEEQPTGMLIDGGRGNVLWAPTRAQAGPHAVRIRATNTAGSDEQSYTLEVYTTPIIATIPNQRIAPEKEFVVTPTTDAYPDPVYALNSGPDGLTIDENTGIIRWTPTSQQEGTHVVLFEASNVAGKGQQSFTLDVDATVNVDGRPQSASDFRILSAWPQPASSLLHISMTIPLRTDELRLAVYDALGRMRLKRSIQHSSGSRAEAILPLGRLENGVYHIVVTSSAGARGRQIIIAR